jgi:hypothetical protein
MADSHSARQLQIGKNASLLKQAEREHALDVLNERRGTHKA